MKITIRLPFVGHTDPGEPAFLKKARPSLKQIGPATAVILDEDFVSCPRVGERICIGERGYEVREVRHNDESLKSCPNITITCW